MVYAAARSCDFAAHVQLCHLQSLPNVPQGSVPCLVRWPEELRALEYKWLSPSMRHVLSQVWVWSAASMGWRLNPSQIHSGTLLSLGLTFARAHTQHCVDNQLRNLVSFPPFPPKPPPPCFASHVARCSAAGDAEDGAHAHAHGLDHAVLHLPVCLRAPCVLRCQLLPRADPRPEPREPVPLQVRRDRPLLPQSCQPQPSSHTSANTTAHATRPPKNFIAGGHLQGRAS
eukprot:1176489-Rhodomonas_salina.2